MKAFCTRCGAAWVPGAAVCAGCGARKRRKWPWILALILLFVLGFLLGRLLAPKCPICPAPPAPGHGGAGGAGGGGGGGARTQAGAGGKGTPDSGGGGGGGGGGRVLGDGGHAEASGGGGSAGGGDGTGDMQGGGGGNANGITVGHGNDGSAVGAPGGDDGGGGGDGKSTPGDSPNGPDIEKEAKDDTKAGVWRLATGAPMSPGTADLPQGTGKDTSVKGLSAWDFRYDKTGLPRYPDANQAVLSAMSYDLPGRTDAYGSSSGIITTSAFGDVVDWYRKNLPPNWTATTLGDMNQLGAVSQQFSPANIMQMLSAPDGTTAAKTPAEVPATAAADRISISMFAPPAGTKGDPGIMVVQKGSHPVEIFMKTHVTQAQ
jgi:hypothetical protein